MKKEEIAREAKSHKKRAVELLKESQHVHEASRRGTIPESEAVDEAVRLNNAAIDEADKAIALEKEYISRSEGDAVKG